MKRLFRRLDEGRSDETAVVSKLGPHDIYRVGCHFEGRFLGSLGSNVEEEVYAVNHATAYNDALRVPEVDEAGKTETEIDARFPDAIYYEGVALFYGLGEWL